MNPQSEQIFQKIQVLDSDTVNQIAAGEVVERPSHLVKELIENSLDAKCTSVTIDVSEGGRIIKVKDNGQGIFSNDLSLALQRHATSKIRKTEDLWKLNSFGFRGEALASASAVSKLTLRSQEMNEKKPSQIVSEFGLISSIKPSSLTAGTEVLIENLFENVPARLKFLKSASAEHQQIKTVVKAMALSRPDVEFRLTIENKLELFFPRAENFVERATSVLSLSKMYSVKEKHGPIEVEIAFASPSDVAKTSKNIWVFVQNRWVQDRSLQMAVQEAYRSLLMHGEYPYAVLKLSCPADSVDVNIHPTKTQIKFLDSSLMFKVTHGVLRRAIEKAPWKSDYESGLLKSQPHQSSFQDQMNLEKEHFENLKFSGEAFEKNNYQTKSNTEVHRNQENQSPGDNFSKTYTNENQSLLITPVINENSFTSELKKGFWSRLHVIGQLNLTYILTQNSEKFVLVDQHAAHERVVFETLMDQYKKGRFEIQSFLFPLILDLSPDKADALETQSSQLEKMGFSLERMGPQTIGIKSSPAIIKENGLVEVFDRMAQEILDNGGSFVLEKKMIDLFATMACHSVVRAGQSLSLEEMKTLLVQMDQFELSSYCPHGRPVFIEMSFYEIEKMFGRIPG